MPDLVSPQVTDAVTQANVKVLGESPAMAMGVVYQSLGQAVAMMLDNATQAQQQTQMVARVAMGKIVEGIVKISVG